MVKQRSGWVYGEGTQGGSSEFPLPYISCCNRCQCPVWYIYKVYYKIYTETVSKTPRLITSHIIKGGDTLNSYNFKELSLDQLTATQGGTSFLAKLIAELGTAASNFATGFVTSTRELAETSYNAGYQLGRWLSK